MGIDFKPNTVTALEGIIGEKLNYIILDELLNRYRTEFAKARKKPQSYILGILKKKVQEDYNLCKWDYERTYTVYGIVLYGGQMVGFELAKAEEHREVQ